MTEVAEFPLQRKLTDLASLRRLLPAGAQAEWHRFARGRAHALTLETHLL